MGTLINTSVSPEIPFSHRVSKVIENCQRMPFFEPVEGAHRGTNTSPILGPTKQQDAKTSLTKTLLNEETSEQMPEHSLQPESVEITDTSNTDTNTL